MFNMLATLSGFNDCLIIRSRNWMNLLHVRSFVLFGSSVKHFCKAENCWWICSEELFFDFTIWISSDWIISGCLKTLIPASDLDGLLLSVHNALVSTFPSSRSLYGLIWFFEFKFFSFSFSLLNFHSIIFVYCDTCDLSALFDEISDIADVLDLFSVPASLNFDASYFLHHHLSRYNLQNNQPCSPANLCGCYVFRLVYFNAVFDQLTAAVWCFDLHVRYVG